MKKRKNKYIPPKKGHSKKNSLFSMHSLIAILIVFNLLTASVTLSKFATSSNPFVDLARVAKFDIQLEYPGGSIVEADYEDNRTVSYIVKVTNNSEVDVDCTPVLTTKSSTHTISESNLAKVYFALGENAEVYAPRSAGSNGGHTFKTGASIGTIDSGETVDLKVTFKLVDSLKDKNANIFVDGIKLTMTYNQVD